MGNVLIDISPSNILLTLPLPAKYHPTRAAAVSINGLMLRLLLLKAQGCKDF